MSTLFMPTRGVATMSLDPVRRDLLTGTLDGKLRGVMVGQPRQRVEVTLANALEAEEADEWTAFVDALEGMAGRFTAYDLSRKFPREHAAGWAGWTRPGGGAFDGTFATGQWGTGADRDYVYLSGVPAGLKLRKRDPISFVYAVGALVVHAGVRAVTDGDEAGGALVVTVQPRIPSVVPAGASVRISEAATLFRLVPDQTTLGPIDAYHSRGGTIVGLQEIVG